MKRAAIYARFSSDLQNDRSIDDQIAHCREIAARESFAVVATFEDRAASGASAVNRPGFLAMMRSAERRDFDVIIAEDIDRISRDQGDYHAARKKLEFYGVALHTSTGTVSRLDGSLRALMGEMYLENLALHTRRGLAGVVRDGRSAGGRAYGYRPIPGEKGKLAIVESEADTIREVFERYAKGESARAIAADLNARRIPAPRGERWNASTINGNATRGNGIILNDLYNGRIVWNRVRMIKDPSTGKRISRPNAKAEHKTADAARLKIVDDELWAAAQAVKAIKSTTRPEASRKPKRLLSGLLKCGSCGAGMSSHGTDRKGVRLQCSAVKESGTCSNTRRVYRDDVEAAVLDGLAEKLIAPEWFELYISEYLAERKRLMAGATASRARLERRAGEIRRELARAVEAILKGTIDHATMAEPIRRLEQEKEAVDAELATLNETAPAIAIHPAAVAQYRRDVNALQALLAADGEAESDEVIARVRRLVESVTVHAQTGVKGFTLEIRGRLAELIENSRRVVGGNGGSEGGTRTPDTRIMIPLL